jgi:hypothetical protein
LRVNCGKLTSPQARILREIQEQNGECVINLPGARKVALTLRRLGFAEQDFRFNWSITGAGIRALAEHEGKA